MNILHLSHTDIKKDNRILKEMLAVKAIKHAKIYGIGVELDETNVSHSTSLDKSISTLKLRSKKFKFLPKIFRYSLNLIELFVLSFLEIKKIRPKLIHCHDTLVLPIGYIYKMVNPKVLLIYDAHELESQKNGQNSILSICTFFTEKVIWRKIDGFITVSESIQKWYMENLGPKPCCILFNSPVISKEPVKTSLGLRERFNLKKDARIFLYVGYISTGRNIENLIEVFKENDSDSILIFIGYGPLVDYVEKSARENSSIYYHEPVRHDELVSLLREANAGLCLIPKSSLSDYYALPNKFFEYIQAGLTVISSDFPDLKNTIKNYNLGYCCNPHSKEEILKAIRSFKEKEIVISDNHPLSWNYQSRKLQKFYNQIIKS